MNKKLPVYSAIIENNLDGIYCISLVDMPATEVHWQCFSRLHKEAKFSIENEEQHIISSVVMLAETPIYRRNADGFEYNIIYHKDTIRLMSEKMLSDNSHNNIDINHNGELLEKGSVSLVELFIKDSENGINPPYFSSIPEGSLIAKYKIHDEELWKMCKDGTLNGISLAGYFGVEQEKITNNFKSKRKTMLNKFKNMLKDILLQFGEVKTDNGILYYDGEDLVEGLAVTNENEEAVEDGDYKLEDGSILTIKDSKISKITPAPEEVVEEPEQVEAEENDNPDDNIPATPSDDTSDKEDLKAEIEGLKAEIESMKSEIESLKESIKTIAEAPAAEPVAEEFKHVVEIKENKAAKIASYLKK